MRRVRPLLWLGGALTATALMAGDVTLEQGNTLDIPITPFSNMASGYQATNPGFRAILKSPQGDFIAGGHMTIDAAIRGYSDDASQGSAYGRLVLRVEMTDAYPGVSSGVMNGSYKGVLSICMAKNQNASVADTECQSLSGNIHPDRPFQWLNKPVDFVVENGNIKITRFQGNTGEGGTSQQLALAAFHPAYGFAAPGKAFKDYQSPLVLDLNGDGEINLINVWAEAPVVSFDLTGAAEKIRTGWVAAQDAFLFWDNGSGCVENGTQFFGEYTHSKHGEKTFANGFEALKAVSGVKGKTLVAKNFPKLKVWRDTNQDGVCSVSEVTSAKTYVKEISLEYHKLAVPEFVEDNEVRLSGSYVAANGTRRLLADVWLKQRRNWVAKH